MIRFFALLIFIFSSWSWGMSQAGMMLQKKSASGALDTTHVTVSMVVSASANDAEQEGTTVFTTSSDLEMCWDGVDADVGVGFDGHASLTNGIEIVSAYVQFTSDHTAGTNGDVTLIIYGADQDDAPLPFSAGANNVSDRPATTAQVTWTPDAWVNNDRGADQQTPDLKDIIQEIVDRPGYAANSNFVIVVIQQTPGTTADRRADSFDGAGAGDEPELFVKYVQVN